MPLYMASFRCKRLKEFIANDPNLKIWLFARSEGGKNIKTCKKAWKKAWKIVSHNKLKTFLQFLNVNIKN
jgi:hypothetical protein